MKQKYTLIPRYEPYNLYGSFVAHGLLVINNTRYGVYIKKGASTYFQKPNSFTYSFPDYDYFVSSNQSLVIPVYNQDFSILIDTSVAPNYIVNYPDVTVITFDNQEKILPYINNINEQNLIPKTFFNLGNTHTLLAGEDENFTLDILQEKEYGILRFLNIECSASLNAFRFGLAVSGSFVFYLQSLLSVSIPLNVIIMPYSQSFLSIQNFTAASRTLSYQLFCEIYPL